VFLQLPEAPPPAPAQVQGSAKKAFGPVLDRHAKAERIKSVANLLKRFGNLFNMPSRINQLAAAG
jgi:hypothetical protein